MPRIDVKNLINLAVPVEAATLETNTKIRKRNAIIRRTANGIGFVAGAAIGIGAVAMTFKSNVTSNSDRIED